MEARKNYIYLSNIGLPRILFNSNSFLQRNQPKTIFEKLFWLHQHGTNPLGVYGRPPLPYKLHPNLYELARLKEFQLR